MRRLFASAALLSAVYSLQLLTLPKANAESVVDRVCVRVVKNYASDTKMWDRVNDRVEKRFGVRCQMINVQDLPSSSTSSQSSLAQKQDDSHVSRRVLRDKTVSCDLAGCNSRRTINTVSQTSNNAFLNLIANQKWKIRLVSDPEVVLGNTFNDGYTIDVSRNGDKMTVKGYNNDGKTGEIKWDSSADWSVYFSKACAKDQKECLTLSRTTYKYYDYKLGNYTDMFFFPIDLTPTTTAQQYSSTYYTVGEGNYSDREFKVNILSKDASDISCVVRGETHDGQLIYYTPDSQYFNDLYKFKCFPSEEEANKAGYKKSLN